LLASFFSFVLLGKPTEVIHGNRVTVQLYEENIFFFSTDADMDRKSQHFRFPIDPQDWRRKEKQQLLNAPKNWKATKYQIEMQSTVDAAGRMVPVDTASPILLATADSTPTTKTEPICDMMQTLQSLTCAQAATTCAVDSYRYTRGNDDTDTKTTLPQHSGHHGAEPIYLQAPVPSAVEHKTEQSMTEVHTCKPVATTVTDAPPTTRSVLHQQLQAEDEATTQCNNYTDITSKELAFELVSDISGACDSKSGMLLTVSAGAAAAQPQPQSAQPASRNQSKRQAECTAAAAPQTPRTPPMPSLTQARIKHVSASAASKDTSSAKTERTSNTSSRCCPHHMHRTVTVMEELLEASHDALHAARRALKEMGVHTRPGPSISSERSSCCRLALNSSENCHTGTEPCATSAAARGAQTRGPIGAPESLQSLHRCSRGLPGAVAVDGGSERKVPSVQADDKDDHDDVMRPTIINTVPYWQLQLQQLQPLPTASDYIYNYHGSSYQQRANQSHRWTAAEHALLDELEPLFECDANSGHCDWVEFAEVWAVRVEAARQLHAHMGGSLHNVPRVKSNEQIRTKVRYRMERSKAATDSWKWCTGADQHHRDRYERHEHTNIRPSPSQPAGFECANVLLRPVHITVGKAITFLTRGASASQLLAQ
jgi:hypothetical protein